MTLDRRVATEYIRCLWPKLVTQEMQILEGLINGITIDGRIAPDEVPALQGWCRRYEHVREMRPFSEIIARIEDAIADGVIDDEDRADILWLCQRFSRSKLFFNSIATDIQRLQGMLSGIAADQVIAPDELSLLQSWVAEHVHLQGYWPYDEIDSLLQSTLKDGVISPQEHQILLDFCADLLVRTTDSEQRPREKLLRRIVCATNPKIIFPNQVFCLAGHPERGSSSELAEVIRELGGRLAEQVDMEVHYLVIGARGGEVWALSFYGRKVEAALSLRRRGVPLKIVHEHDFWDAVSWAR
jgi:hypothetical protein